MNARFIDPVWKPTIDPCWFEHLPWTPKNTRWPTIVGELISRDAARRRHVTRPEAVERRQNVPSMDVV